LEDIRIDSHKLMLHPRRVADWLEGKNIYPIGAELSLTNSCNCRCIFCAFDYTGYRPIFLKQALVLQTLEEMAQGGVKSLVIAGEGEPMLHPDAADIICQAKAFGLDVALATNGICLTADLAKACLPALTWVRFSLNAGSAASYEVIHGCTGSNYIRVLDNIATAVDIKKSLDLPVTLGVQLLLLPDNLAEVESLAQTLRHIGVDYFTVKPFSRHPQSQCSLDPDFDYSALLGIETALRALETPDYKIFFRGQSMQRLCSTRRYSRCYGLPFLIYIDSLGNVIPCLVFVGQDEMIYGNLYQETFPQIWQGQKRQQVLKAIEQKGVEQCRELCRLDQVNEYLHDLQHPGGHVNFV